MERRELTFRVFVIATFSNLVAERNALQERVFPRLLELCQKNGARFQAIDLRFRLRPDRAAPQDCGGQGELANATVGCPSRAEQFSECC